MRLSFVGELGWELHIPKDACLPVYHAVMAAGAKHGIINSGYRAIDSLSIEKGQVKGQTQPQQQSAELESEFNRCRVPVRVQALARGPPPR